jgi:nitrite reductase/ring-hydroxylating ferredoxin subunit
MAAIEDRVHDEADANVAYSGYYQAEEVEIDDALTRVGPGTPCGEYLRRYWHPVALTQDLGELPLPVRILGENLVLFRDGEDRIGLVHRNCPHRRASLEFGICESRGIRCCYHGWLFDVDGTILEIPCEREDNEVARKVQATTRLGAYPVREQDGLIFAYMGPPAEKPPFPVFDMLEMDGINRRPYKAPFECNWLQVLDAILDPVHTTFLHSQVSRQQFSEGMAELGELKFYERDEMRFMGTNSRRVGDHIWIRLNELILPNFTQAGAAFATDGTQSRYFGRSAFTRWVVPVDDTNCIAFAWANFGDRADPEEYNTDLGAELIEQGEPLIRPYEEKQRHPADVEAVEGMGPITEHRKENLLPCDRGISVFRRRVRRLCRELQDGKPPPQPADLGDGAIATYGCDTVLNVPADGEDDRALVRKVNDAVMTLKFEAERLPAAERDATIISGLKAIEVDGVN